MRYSDWCVIARPGGLRPALLLALAGCVAAALPAVVHAQEAHRVAQAQAPDVLPAASPANPAPRRASPMAPGPASQLVDFGLFRISANAAVVSEYRFRGVRLSGGNPAVQAGVEIDHLAGFYVGAFASTLDNATLGYGGAELDLYAGWSGRVAEGLRADLGAIAYLFPDAGPTSGPTSGPNSGPLQAQLRDTDYVELYGSLTYTLGPGLLRVGGAWDVGEGGLSFAGPEAPLLTRDNLYFYADLRVGLPATPLTFTGHVGHTTGWRDLPAGHASPSRDWSVGAEFSLSGPLSLGLAYVEADGGGWGVAQPGVAGLGEEVFNPTRGTVVGTLRASF